MELFFMSGNVKEIYFAFYLLEPIWIIDPVNVMDENIQSHFTNLMSEEVFKHETQEYILKFCRDGMFLFKIKSINITSDADINLKEWKTNVWISYLQCANVIALLFQSAFLEITNIFNHFKFHELTIRDAFEILFIDGIPKGHHVTTAEKFQLSRYFSQADIMSPFFLARRIISNEILEKTVNDLKGIYKNQWLLSLLSEFLKSINQFKITNFNTALVLAWFIVESILNEKWENWKKLNKNILEKVPVAGKTKKISKIWQVFDKMLILKDYKELPTKFFETLDKMRKIRNDIAHKGIQCLHEDAENALNDTREFIEYHFNFKLTIDLTLTYRTIDFDELSPVL